MASSDMKLDLIISAQDLASKEIEGIRRKLDDLTKSTSETWKNSDGVFSLSTINSFNLFSLKL